MKLTSPLTGQLITKHALFGALTFGLAALALQMPYLLAGVIACALSGPAARLLVPHIPAMRERHSFWTTMLMLVGFVLMAAAGVLLAFKLSLAVSCAMFSLGFLGLLAPVFASLQSDAEIIDHAEPDLQ